ncbi:MAG: TSUP family transporter [Neisseria sp.]|nr:TSUP family transporter [Neisseria sp.]
MEITLETAAFLFAVATGAGFIDAIAGGGGLLTLPALLAAGVPAAAALGTNKLQASGGSFAASLYFVRQGAVDLQALRFCIAMTFTGAAAGALTVQLMNVDDLKTLLPFLVFAIGLYFLFSPNIGQGSGKARLSLAAFALTAALGIGFYDGVFGPATGSFLTLAFISLLGFALPQAVAHAKVLNFTSNFASLLFFILGGAVLWKIGLLMLCGQLIGGYFGARTVVGSGKKLIRPLLVLMSFAMVGKMVYEQGWLG